MTKLHPSIVITRGPNYTDVSVNGEYRGTYTNPEVADQFATTVSGVLWSIEVSERPAKPRPQRIWDETL